MQKQSDSPKPDRRIQRTKNLLAEALVELIIEKGYEATTVQDIINRANVGRSTFYAHFENKEQLLLNGKLQIEKMLFGERVAVQTFGNETIDLFSIFQHIVENARIAKIMLRDPGGEMVIKNIQYAIAQSFMPAVSRSIGQKKMTASNTDGENREFRKNMMDTLIAEVIAAALVRFIVVWVEHGMPFTPEEMVVKSHKLIEVLKEG